MGVPLGARTSKQAKKQPEEKLTLIFSVLVFQPLICKFEQESQKSVIFRIITFIISNLF
jgi:hypothetical protein